MGLLLYIIALALRTVLFPIGFVVGMIKAFYQHHFDTGLKNADRKFLFLAISIDTHGNVICGDLFTLLFITRETPVRFGQWGQTVSAVLGHNEAAGTLTKAGRLLCFVLNRIDPAHTSRAAQTDKYKP